MEIVCELNECALGLAIFALMMAASKTGYRSGLGSAKPAARDTKLQHLTVEPGILGILGLLLGFTKAMARLHELPHPAGRRTRYLGQIAAARQQSAQLHEAFWQQTAAYGQKDPKPVPGGACYCSH